MGCKECAFCGSPDSQFECARCDVRYCGKECQSKDWVKAHKTTCKKSKSRDGGSKPNSEEKDKERKDNGESEKKQNVEENPRICAACGTRNSISKCECKLVYYCNEACQKKHRKTHLKHCPVALREKADEQKAEGGKDSKALMETRVRMAVEHRDHGQHPQALKLFQKVYQSILAVYGEKDWNVAEVLRQIGKTQTQMGQYSEATKNLIQAMKVCRKNETERGQPELLSDIMRDLACTLTCQGSYEAAFRRFEQSREILLENFGPDCHALAYLWDNHASALAALGRSDEALPMFEESLRIERLHQNPGKEDKGVASTYLNIAACKLNQGTHEEARKNFEKALTIYRREHGEWHPDVAQALHNIGICKCIQGEFDDALNILTKALKIRRKVLGKNHDDVAQSLMAIGKALNGQGKYDEAFDQYREAMDMYQRCLGRDAPPIATLLFNMAETKEGEGEKREALKYANQSLAMFSKLGMVGSGAWANCCGLQLKLNQDLDVNQPE